MIDSPAIPVASERQRARPEQGDRHGHPRHAEAAHGEDEPDDARERHGRPGDVGEKRHERARDVLDPAHAAQRLGELARRVQAVERIAGDGEIDKRPAHRSERGQRGEPDPRPHVATAQAPQPIGARQHPGLGPQQPGRREQRHRCQPAPGPRGLERRRPEDERKERHVDERPHGVQQEREARAGEQRAEQPRPDAEEDPPERVGPRDERHQAQHRREHEQPVGVLAGKRQQRSQREVQRMLGRRGERLKARRDAVSQVATPDEVVVGVVVRIRRHERPGRDRREHHGSEPQTFAGGGHGTKGGCGRRPRRRAHGSAGSEPDRAGAPPSAAEPSSRARAAPTASSAHASGSSRNAA